MDVGFIGLGRMGSAMAKNLARAGHRVRAWNRSSKPGDVLEGVERVATPVEAFDADVVFTMLSDDNAIRDVILKHHVLRHARPGAVHVVASTISIAFAEELRTAHGHAGMAFVGAPVFGRPDAAEAAKLTIVAAGDAQAIEKVRPLFEKLGGRIVVLGDDPKQAYAAKIAGNMMIAMALEAMGEAAALVSRNGVAPERFFEIVIGSLFAGRGYENYVGNIVKNEYEPGFRMQLGLKDLRLAVAAAQSACVDLPMLQAVHGQMKAAVDAGMAEKDWSGVAGYTIAQGR